MGCSRSFSHVDTTFDLRCWLAVISRVVCHTDTYPFSTTRTRLGMFSKEKEYSTYRSLKIISFPEERERRNEIPTPRSPLPVNWEGPMSPFRVLTPAARCAGLFFVVWPFVPGVCVFSACVLSRLQLRLRAVIVPVLQSPYPCREQSRRALQPCAER